MGRDAMTFGSVSFANSGAAAAQPAFLRGLALLHNFQYEEAAAAFREAQKLAPGFAMAFWGEAMTHNHGVWREQDSLAAKAVLARLGATPTERLAKAPTVREKDYLRSLDVLYSSTGTKAGRDSAYADATRQLAARYPRDVDAQLFYALALLSLVPRTDSTYLQAGSIAEHVMRDHPQHPGALHYVIHAYDDPAHASQGLAAARAYSKVAADAPHAQHMTSHIFVALGMWDDVVAANEVTIHTVEKQRGVARADQAKCGHPGLWLHYAYLQQGRLGDARRMMDGCRAAGARALGLAAGYAEMRLRFIIDVDQSPSDVAPLGDDVKLRAPDAFVQDFATAYDALRRGDTIAAVPMMQRMHGLSTTIAASPRARDNPELVEQISVIEDELQAMLLLKRGSKDEALALMRRVTAREDKLPFAFGPPEIEKPSHELLGEMLLDVGSPAEARRELAIALAHTPGRSLTLLDMTRANRALGDSAAAVATNQQLMTNWHRADRAAKP
jgi:tetratricopeptide (TPR) repeat protein